MRPGVVELTFNNSTYYGATLHRRNGPGRSCKLVDRQRDQTTHQSNTLIRHPRSTQHSKRTIFRIQSHAFQQERIKSAQDHGLAPTELASNRIRSASRSTLSQHTSDQRAEAAQWVRLWVAEPPPRANHVSSIPSPVPVDGRASRLIQLGICVPLQPRTDKTFKLPVSDHSGQCEEAGGWQAGESWFKPAPKWTLEVHQLTASCLP